LPNGPRRPPTRIRVRVRLSPRNRDSKRERKVAAPQSSRYPRRRVAPSLPPLPSSLTASLRPSSRRLPWPRSSRRRQFLTTSGRFTQQSPPSPTASMPISRSRLQPATSGRCLPPDCRRSPPGRLPPTGSLHQPASARAPAGCLRAAAALSQTFSSDFPYCGLSHNRAHLISEIQIS
jgi:hypothetical protein